MKRKNKKNQKNYRKRTQTTDPTLKQPPVHPPVNRLYKDRLFHMLFSHKETLLSLYNALNGTHYTNPDDLTITTLENAIYMGMHNDVSCILFSNIYFYEQQASICPNMPFRSLLYIADTLRGLTVDNDIYSSTLISLPTPHFVTFYNGMEPMEKDETLLKLSDTFEVATDHPELELTVRVLNINKGHNEDLKNSCLTLKQYMQFVEKTRECLVTITNQTTDAPLSYMDKLDLAVTEAVDYCISRNILGDFLKKHRNEVIAVTLYEYSEEEHRRIQERDKLKLKKQLEETIAELHQVQNSQKQSEAMLKQSSAKLKQSNAKLEQAIHNTISLLRDMGCDDSEICAKLCNIYQLSTEEALMYLHSRC